MFLKLLSRYRVEKHPQREKNMNREMLLVAVMICALFARVNAVTPVVNEVKVDTSQYENRFSTQVSLTKLQTIGFIPGPLNARSELWNNITGGVCMFAYLKKNSNVFDIYSIGGKCGSSTVPNVKNKNGNIIFSQTFIDDDAGWESITCYTNYLSEVQFTVFDDDGTELVSDSGSAGFGFDGSSTYVIRNNENYENLSIKSWRFRTNITSTSEPSLKKTASSSPPLMMTYGMSNGSYRVTLLPSTGGQTTMQLFDLVGRLLFTKQLDCVTSPVTFTIPEKNIPASPFIAKVKNKDGVLYKKEIPVH